MICTCGNKFEEKDGFKYFVALEEYLLFCSMHCKLKYIEENKRLDMYQLRKRAKGWGE